MSTAFVIADFVGTKAGGYVAPLLLCRKLKELGLRVTAFVQLVDFGGETPPEEFRTILPRLRRGWRWSLPSWCLAKQAAWAILRERPEHVFVCSLNAIAGHLLRTRVARQLLVWEFTNANQGNKFVDPMAARRLGNCRAVLSPSAAIDQGIRTTYEYTGPIHRLPFWVEDEGLPWNAPPAECLADFIYLGRRDVEKGLMELIEATAMVARKHPRVRVLISGAGSEAPFVARVKERGVTDNIRFQFFRSRGDTMRALERSRCLVLPSYHEGYPLVLLEAGQRSVPFIATSVGSIPEVYEGTAAGLIIRPKDAEGLAGAMVQVMVEPPESYLARRRAAHAAFRRVSSDESVTRLLQQLLAANP